MKKRLAGLDLARHECIIKRIGSQGWDGKVHCRPLVFRKQYVGLSRTEEYQLRRGYEWSKFWQVDFKAGTIVIRDRHERQSDT